MPRWIIGYNERIKLIRRLTPLEYLARAFLSEEGAYPLATGEVATSRSQDVQQLPNHKVKIKKAGQRACNEKDAKGKFCGGHLKLWFYVNDVVERECGDIEKAWGPNAEVYRCENCKALYLPTPGETKVNVAGKGTKSVFGLTLPPKEAQR
jgi:hypothetical protein